MRSIDRLHVLVPFWGLAGGVIKILDYADHASRLGVRVDLWAPPMPDGGTAVHSLPVVERLLGAQDVHRHGLDALFFDAPEPWVLFTEPTHLDKIDAATRTTLGGRLIHLVQGTRHANPEWHAGRNYRLLHRPMSRIAVSDQVATAISPHVNQRHPTTTIVEGHDCAYFAGRPAAWSSQPDGVPLRILYTTWKSTFGDQLAEHFSDDPRFHFTAIRGETTWPALRNRYHSTDVVLCTPGPEEGFYLPGLEAMASRAAVVSPLVGGNAAYLKPNHNAVVAEYEDLDSHAAALEQLLDADRRSKLIDAGVETCAQHTLERERVEFGSFLSLLADEYDQARRDRDE